MIIYPAIDLYEGKAVRLYKGNYEEMTVYSTEPLSVAKKFKEQGATHIHIVDLEGAKYGTTPNLSLIKSIISETGLFCEVGGGIRDLDTIEAYLSAGAMRVILGTAAVKNRELLSEAVEKYGDKIAVGIDIKDGKVAISGWKEDSGIDCFDFFSDIEKLGVATVISTDISKDGAMQGANHKLYSELARKYSLNLIASGGVSSVADIKKLAMLNIHGAIVGKAYYIGAIDLKEAIEVAK